MESDEGITVNVDGAVVSIVIDRPGRLNSLTTAALDAMAEAIIGADRPDVEVVVLTGAGRAFCTGADLGSDVDAATVAAANRLMTAIGEIEPPVIAGVHGAVAGVGVSIALACDLVIAAESTFLLLPFLGIGLVPDGGATHAVHTRAGRNLAARMAFGGERIPAELAQQWHLLGEVVPDDELEMRVAAVVDRILDAPRSAAVATKRLLRAAETGALQASLEREITAQSVLLGSEEYRRARDGFLQKQPVRFRTHPV